MTKNDRDEILTLDPKIFPAEDSWGIDVFDYFFDKEYSFVSYDQQTYQIKWTTPE